MSPWLAYAGACLLAWLLYVLAGAAAGPFSSASSRSTSPARAMASISGVGTIDYWGEPQVARSTSGLATINARGDKR